MVVFSCDSCGDSLRKKHVEKHYRFKCPRCESLTCVDCKKQFWGDEFAAHTQCITDEDFKYGLSKEHKDDKGQKKQDLWRAVIDDMLADRGIDKRFVPVLLEMQKYENVPRKKKPFMNWTKCTMKRFPYKIVEEAFDLLVELHSKKQQAMNESQGDKKSNGSKVEENDKAANGTEAEVTKLSKKKRKAAEDEPQEGDDEEAQPRKKTKGARELSAEEEVEEPVSRDKAKKKSKKFKLEKYIGEILAGKNDSMKLKKLIRKVGAVYADFCEEQGTARSWDNDEISSRVEKLVSTNKYFNFSQGSVQLSTSGSEKFLLEEIVASD